MSKEPNDILKQLRPSRIILPVLIGVAIVVYLLYREVNAEDNDMRSALSGISWTAHTFFWIFMGFVMMVLRDLAYMWRMRILTDKQMSWRACMEVTLLWEFSSAVSPSIVGGAAVAVFFFIKEKISAGKSTAIVFITIFLDELFYILILPIVLILISNEDIFSPLYRMNAEGSSMFGTSMLIAFWVAYGFIFVYVSFLAIGIFVRPDKVSRMTKRLFYTKLLKRWRRRGFKTADELLIAANEFKSKPRIFWVKAWSATSLAWMARYLVLNCILAAFVTGTMGLYDHVLAFSRQAILFVVMIVSPTPGSSGVAEIFFDRLFEDLVTPAALTLALATLWRLVSYYPYLIIGIPILPRWLKRVYKSAGTPVGTPGKVSDE